MIGYNLEETVNGEVVKRPKLMRNLLNIGLSAIFTLTAYACDLFNKEDPDPVEKVTITNETPVQGSYSDKKKGDKQAFSFDSNSELGLPLEEFYRVDGVKVDNDSEYTHTFDKKGVTTIEGVAKTKEDSAKVEWMYTIDNQSPVANDKAVTMDEETTKKIAESELGTDPDGDELEYNVTSTSAGVNAEFKNGQLEITGEQDYFGNANVNYNVSDGEATDNGTISVTINNTPDNPNANAGQDKTGTINEEITLDASNSSHPDNPISNITIYLWKALNEEENITITDSDKANATITANTRGNYNIELTVTDNQGAIDKDTVNVNINSYKIIINTTNVLTDANISGLEVALAGKTAFTNSAGQATLEYPTNTTLSGNLKIKDENIQNDIGDFFNYSDTESTSIDSDKELNIEMVPNVAFNSQFYTDVFDFLTQMRGKADIGSQPGDYPEDYPILIDVKESDMPAEHYKQATTEAIEHINQTLGWEVYKTTTNDDARYVFDYTHDNSKFEPSLVQINDVWYIDNATVYILNAATNSSWFEILKGEITHELFTHGLGWSYHSLDSQDISNTPVWDSDITQNEKNAMEIFLKLQGGTKLNNYQIE